MQNLKESEVLSLLQPDLFTVDELLEKINSSAEQKSGETTPGNIQSSFDNCSRFWETCAEKLKRCGRIKNLGSMTKEGLVGLFRQIILPYPQRIYRTNRRGKMLTSRRANAGLESRREDERSGFSNDRLKPPPDISNPQAIRINSQSDKRQSDLDSIVINDRRKYSRGEPERRDADRRTSSLSSGRNFYLKRPYGYEKSGPPSQVENKKARTTVRWP